MNQLYTKCLMIGCLLYIYICIAYTFLNVINTNLWNIYINHMSFGATCISLTKYICSTFTVCVRYL